MNRTGMNLRLAAAYRKITRVQGGNGQDTSFWDDVWVQDCPPSELMPALYSHFDGRGTSVCEILASPLRDQF